MMTFQEFIEKLCDHYLEAVVPFLKNRRKGVMSWAKYTGREDTWDGWITRAFNWIDTPEEDVYWFGIATNEPVTKPQAPDLNKRIDEVIETESMKFQQFMQELIDLDERVAIKWLKNMIRAGNLKRKHLKERESFGEWVGFSYGDDSVDFSWPDSPEGKEYWLKVSERINPEEKPPSCGENHVVVLVGDLVALHDSVEYKNDGYILHGISMKLAINKFIKKYLPKEEKPPMRHFVNGFEMVLPKMSDGAMEFFHGKPEEIGVVIPAEDLRILVHSVLDPNYRKNDALVDIARKAKKSLPEYKPQDSPKQEHPEGRMQDMSGRMDQLEGRIVMYVSKLEKRIKDLEEKLGIRWKI